MHEPYFCGLVVYMFVKKVSDTLLDVMIIYTIAIAFSDGESLQFGNKFQIS